MNFEAYNKKIHKQPRDSISARRMSMRSEQIIAFLRSMWPPNEGIKMYMGYNRKMHIQGHIRYDQLFPHCEIMPDIMNNLDGSTPFIYVRKNYGQQNLGGHRRIVSYLATLEDLDDNINSYDDFKKYVKTFNEWVSFSVCSNDNIVNLKTNDQVRLRDGRMVSARRCGMASLLAYLCFLDSDHLTNARGFLLENDPNWQDGNMPELSTFPGDFDNGECSRIIRADAYEQLLVETTPQVTQKKTGHARSWPGNKAIIYGAAAAHFIDMVSYNPSPCRQQQGQQVCCMNDGTQGSCFLTTDLVDSFNLHDPKPLIIGADAIGQNYLEMDDFMRHYGRHWYFCRRIPFRAYQLHPKKLM